MAEPADWILSQKKVFTNWVNLYLGKREMQVKDLQTDFSDGVLLCNLMEIISGKKMPTRWKTEAKNRLLRVQNLNIALQFIAEEGIRLVACGSEDICDNNLKLIMGMIWTLILRYQIQTGNLFDKDSKKMSAKEALMTWVQQNTGSYSDVPVRDFHVSWQDGRAFCALVHRLAPEHIDMKSLSNDDKLANLNLAFDVANKVLGVPKLLDANDIAGSPKPDEQSIMTYVSLFPRLYADKGIVADGAGSNEAKNKPEEDEKKKKEEEEKNKDEEKKKQEEDKKKKEDERKSLMVKAKSHGEVNKISDLEDKLRQAEIKIKWLTNENKESDSKNDLLEKEKGQVELEKGQLEKEKGQVEKEKELESLRADTKMKELEERLKKAEEEVKERDERLQKGQNEAKEMEERLRKVEEDAKENLRRLEEESASQRGESDQRINELLRRLAEAEAKMKEEGESAAKWKAHSEDNTKKLEDAERRLRELEENNRKREEEDRHKREEEVAKQEEERNRRENENNDKVKALEDKLAQLEKSRQESDNEANRKMEDQKIETTSKLAELEQTIQRLEGEKSEVEKRDAEKLEKIEALYRENEEKQRRVEELEAKAKDLQKGAQDKENGNAELREQLRKLEEENINKEEEKRKLEEVNKLLAERLQKEKEESEKRDDEKIKELEERLRAADETIKREGHRVHELEEEMKKTKEDQARERQEKERLMRELEDAKRRLEDLEKNKVGTDSNHELDTKLRDKTQEYETAQANLKAMKTKREEDRAYTEELEKRAEEYKRQLDWLIQQTDGIRLNTDAIVAQLESGLENDKHKLQSLEDQLAKATRDGGDAQKANSEMEERLRRESEAHAAAQRELDQMKKVSSEDSRKVKDLADRVAELEALLKGSDNGFAQEIDKKSGRIKELEELLRERESEAARDVVAYRTKSESQTKDLRYALEQVQSFHDMVSIQGDALTTAKLELQHIEQELSYSNQSSAELVHEVKQLSRTIATLKAKFIHSFSNLPISEYPQFSSGLFASHSKVTVTFSVLKSTLSLSSGACQFFDEHAKPLTKHQEHTKFTSKNELQIDFSVVPEEVSCILVILTLEGGVLVGGESVKGEVLVDFKKEHLDKIDLNIALDKRAVIDKLENSANVPKRLVAIMFSKCEDDENTLWGTVKRFNFSEGIWRVGTVGIFDCEKPAANFGLLHKLVPIKRYGWTAFSDIQDIYALLAHLDGTLTLNTKELSRMNHEISSFDSTRRELEQKLEVALSQKCIHGDQRISNETLIKYKFLTNSQFSFFGLFLLEVIMQQTSVTLSRQLGPANPADPTFSPRTVRNNNTQLRNNVQTELTQFAETEATFKGLMTSSSTLVAEYAQSEEREVLAAQISRVQGSLETLVSQLERDKAIAYAMKSSLQLQQFLGAEAEKLVLDSEEAGTGTGTGAGRKQKSAIVPSAEDVYTLLDEFRVMEYVENEDTIPQDMPQNNSTLLLVHAVHHAAQQALFSGKISKSIATLQQGVPSDSDLSDQIKKEADRRYADMQGWVGEWISNLGKLAGLVTSRSGTIVSLYVQFQKDYEKLRGQHQEIKDKLDFLGNEQKVNEEEELIPEKLIPIISVDIEEEPKKAPGTPPLGKKQIKGSLSPISRRTLPTSKTPPPLSLKSSSPTSSYHAKTLPLKSPSTKLAAIVKEKKAAGNKAAASKEGPLSSKSSPSSPVKAAPPSKSGASSAVEVDKQLGEILAKLQVTGPIDKIGDCQYQIGSKKVTMQVISGYLVVRVGGGFMKFEEWIMKFGRKEGLMIAGEPISGTGAAVLTAHGNMSMKAMPHKEK